MLQCRQEITKEEKIMARIIQASITQRRVLALLNKDFDGSYDMAARLLEAMGLPKNGVPAGQTPGSVKKMTDAELLELLPTADTSVEVLTTQELKAQERAHWARVRAEAEARREADRKARRKQNDALAAAGYRWQKWSEEDREGFDPEAHLKNDAWVLVDSQGRPVDLDEALKAAGYYTGPGFVGVEE